MSENTLLVSVNGRRLEIEGSKTLASLLKSFSKDIEGPYAVAVNDEHVPRDGYKDKKLAGGDRIEIVTVRQGG